MVFSSLLFLFIFFPIFFIIYYLIPFKYKNLLITIFSLIFYAWGEPVYIVLMIFTSLVNYLAGRLLEKAKHKKTILTISIIISLLLLGFFKYSNFLITNINSLFNLNLNLLELALPIGISFYTFQAISYTVDVYRKEVSAEKNFITFLAYISMFPQLIAGPIVRYKTISEELQHREINYHNFTIGFIRFIKGLGKKVILANSIGLLFTTIQNNPYPSVIMSWLGLIAFAFQIYFDFSGYSDMAIGMGKMLGFNYLENFNYPYIAQSITDFWRRWHISLSTFFKDYVYIPLGGNRVKKIINIRNILIVWLLTGLWHGASWNFILWGLYYGVLLILEKFVFKKWLDKLPKFFKHLYAIFFILIGWLIFAFEDITLLKDYTLSLLGLNHLPLINNETIHLIKNYFVILLSCSILSTPLISNISTKLNQNKKLEFINFIILLIIYCSIFIIVTAMLVNDSYNPFLYFRF